MNPFGEQHCSETLMLRHMAIKILPELQQTIVRLDLPVGIRVLFDGWIAIFRQDLEELADEQCQLRAQRATAWLAGRVKLLEDLLANGEWIQETYIDHWIHTAFRDQVAAAVRDPANLALIKVGVTMLKDTPEEVLTKFVAAVVLGIAGVDPKGGD